MVKETPSLFKLAAMVVFTMSCFGLLLFLWLAFGGSIPLKPQGYRVEVSFPEAATLAQEADVRMAGVNIGKVKGKELEKGASRTKVELELDKKYAPISRDSRAVLRQKTLLGETYVELSPGTSGSKKLQDGDTLANSQVEPTTELDEIYSSFDKPTRTAFRQWVGELSKAIKGRSQDVNSAFGNLEGFSVDGATLFKELDDQELAVRRLVKNTGRVFGAINERDGMLRDLVVNANNTFEATASKDQALSDTIRVFPTFLDESKATLARLQRFSTNTRPLVNELKPSADDLGPTVRDLGELSPDLEGLFRDLDPLIKAGRNGLPDLEKTLAGAEPLFEAAHVFLPELNPVLSELNFHQVTVAAFISNAAADLVGDFGGQRYQTQVAMIEPKSFLGFPARTRPPGENGNAYVLPNGERRGRSLGVYQESFDCKPNGGERHDPVDALNPLDKRPPCFVAPKQLYNNKQFIKPERGDARVVPPPQGQQGNAPSDPDQR
jgi:phospholipid/cholesterol/gamma-HCH transport system substrate-binding protein